MNLMKFGMEVLGYKNERNCVRNFISKFNERMGFDPLNNTATEKELVRFALNVSKKELKEWANQKLAELLKETETIEREHYVLEEKPKVAKEETKVVKKETKVDKTTKETNADKEQTISDDKAKALLEA